MKIKEADQWTVIYPDMIPLQLPVTVQKLSRTEFIFSFPFGQKGVDVAINRKSLKGSYIIKDQGLTNSITFTVQNKGKELLGKPQGFHGPMIWTFTKD